MHVGYQIIPYGIAAVFLLNNSEQDCIVNSLVTT